MALALLSVAGMLPLFFVATFLVYRAYASVFGIERTARFDKLAPGPFMPRIVLEYAAFLYRLPVTVCVTLGISADMLTYASVVIAGVGAIAIARGRFYLGGWTLLAAFTCDALDGIVARATRTVSKRGELIDSVADHYADLVAYVGFAYYYRDRPSIALLVVLAMIGSSVVSYTRAKGASLGVDSNAGYMRRFERTVWLGGGTVLAPTVAHFLEPNATHPVYHLVVGVMVLLAVLTHVTVLLRARVVIAGLRHAR